MIEISCLEDIVALRESVDIECKLAAGKDGKGKLPKDVWETYSAFANTQGGDIFLGLRELKDQTFEIVGIENTQKVLDELWTGLNNQSVTSGNIIRERWVKVITVDDKRVIQVHVPQAPRKQKPVYIKGNPITGTYKRFNSADIRQTEESVRRMMAEQVEDSRDSEILKGYGIDDLDFDSLNVYRQMYSSRQPDHPWNQVDAQEFLYHIGAWGKDREVAHSGLTRAGLLMFGRLRAIKEAFPHFMLDYQERPEARTEARWIDRFTLDGTWSGSVFDFYRQVIRKLTADIKVPFHLEGDQRQDDSLVHKALREALVNALVHADYTGRASVLVVKRPDMFGFRNPGTMRVPIDIAKSGGESDCRNRNLQDMFRYVGLGENAGSGLPKVFQGWHSQHWREPLLKEKIEPSEQTLLELHTLSLVPEHILSALELNYGPERFKGLTENERLVLVTCHIETTVDHSRMISMLNIHPRDLSSLFSGLVEKGFLQQSGGGRGTIYFMPEARFMDDMAEHEEALSSLIGDGAALGVSSGGSDISSGGFSTGLGDMNEQIMSIASEIANKKRAPKQDVERVILQLCSMQALTLDQLMSLLHRSEGVLRKDYLQPLIKAKKLKYKYPTKPQHPDQAYLTEDAVE